MKLSAKATRAEKIRIEPQLAVEKGFAAEAVVRALVPSGSRIGTCRRVCAWVTAAIMTGIILTLRVWMQHAKTVPAARLQFFHRKTVRTPNCGFGLSWVLQPVASYKGSSSTLSKKKRSQETENAHTQHLLRGDD